MLESEALRGEAWEAAADELAHISGGGGYPTALPAQHRDYIGGSGGVSYDSQLGSLGGGNHFVELQVVAKLHDRASAHAWACARASGHDAELDAFLSQFRVVTPVEPQQLRERPDIRASWRAALKEEAPFAYKAIGPVIATLRQARWPSPSPSSTRS